MCRGVGDRRQASPTLCNWDKRKFYLNSAPSQQILQQPNFPRNDALGKACMAQKGKNFKFLYPGYVQPLSNLLLNLGRAKALVAPSSPSPGVRVTR